MKTPVEDVYKIWKQNIQAFYNNLVGMVSKLDTPRDDLRNLVLTYSDRVSPTKTKVKRRGSSGLKLSACAEIVLTGEEKSVDTTQCPLKRVCGSCICI